MKRTCLLGLVLSLSLCFASTANASGVTIPYQSGWLGPLFSAHFGHGDTEYRIGLEASYWKSLELTQLGVDVGTEYNLSKEKWVHYAELQAGIILGGTSLGWVYDEEYGPGLQWSSWANWIAGGMVRFRWFEAEDISRQWSLGGYVKAPYLFEDDFFNGQW